MKNFSSSFFKFSSSFYQIRCVWHLALPFFSPQAFCRVSRVTLTAKCGGEKSLFGQRVDRLTITWQSEVFNWDTSLRFRWVHTQQKGKGEGKKGDTAEKKTKKKTTSGCSACMAQTCCSPVVHSRAAGTSESRRYVDERHLFSARAIKVTASFLASTTFLFKPTPLKGEKTAQPDHFGEHRNHCCCHPNKQNILHKNTQVIQFTHNTDNSSLTCSFPLREMFHNRKPVI